MNEEETYNSDMVSSIRDGMVLNQPPVNTGKYWFNLMTEDEQMKWYRDCCRVSYDFTKIYDNFEEFIMNTVMQPYTEYYRRYYFRVSNEWWGIIVKYSSYDNLSPRKYLQPLNFSMTM